jgi:hypothetical protein
VGLASGKHHGAVTSPGVEEAMRLYLDTTIANDIFVLLQSNGGDKLDNRDVKTPLSKWVREYIALYYLLDLNDQWALEFGSSPILEEELLRIPTESLHAQSKKNTLLGVHTVLLDNTNFCKLQPVPIDLFNQIQTTFPHRKDIEHICQAILGGWDFFITTDFKSILTRSKRRKLHGITTISPNQFLEDNFMTLEQLIRTFHGPWTTLEDVVDSWVDAIQSSIQVNHF